MNKKFFCNDINHLRHKFLKYVSITYFEFFPGSVDGKTDKCGKCTSTLIVLILVCLTACVIILSLREN